MKYCDEYAALLDLYVDGELSPEEMTAVQAHLDACPGCRAYVDDALAIRAAFPDVEFTPVPDGFAEGVMAAVRAEVPAKAGQTQKNTWKVLAPLAACLAIVAVLQAGPWGNGRKSSFDTAASTNQRAASTSSAGGMEERILETAEAPAEEEASTEEAAPAALAEPGEEPRASVTMDTSSSKDAAASPEQGATAADSGTPQVYTAAHENTYSVRLTLTAEEAGDLLADFTPAAETETEVQYELTAQELDALLAALSEAGISPAWETGSEGEEGSLALITVEK